MPTNERNRIFTNFRKSEYKVLLATNVIAHGIDIRDVCLVINADAPREGRREYSVVSVDTYLQRVGRIGRYSNKGIALSLVDEKDYKYLIDLVKNAHKVEIRKL
jgi:superfamily II DNA/RNA helicase